MDRFSVFTLSATSSDTQPLAWETGDNSGTYCVITRSVNVDSAPVDAEQSDSSGTYCVIAW